MGRDFWLCALALSIGPGVIGIVIGYILYLISLEGP